MQGEKKPGVSGCKLLCNLTKLIFELIKSDSCDGLAVSEDVVSKNLGFSGVDKAQADDAAPGFADITILKLWVLVTRHDPGSLFRDVGVTWLMIRGPRLSSHRVGGGAVLQFGFICPAAWVHSVVHWRSKTRTVRFVCLTVIKPVTFINQLMHSIITVVDVKILLYKSLIRDIIKNYSSMFRIT